MKCLVNLKCTFFKIIAVITLALSCQSITAQTCGIKIVSEGNTKFRITIDNILQHTGFVSNLQILRLKGENTYNIQFEFESDSIILKKRIYLIDEGLTHFYSINKKGLNLKKIIPSTLQQTKEDNALTIAFLANTRVKAPNPTKKDTTSKDTLVNKKFANHYQMDLYEGRIGCAWPLKDEKLIRLKNKIQSKNLEDSKLEIAKESINDIDSICLTMDQTKQLLILFQYEETKLDFAKSIAAYLFDIDNIGKLEDVFDFENSIEELKKEINDQY